MRFFKFLALLLCFGYSLHAAATHVNHTRLVQNGTGSTIGISYAATSGSALYVACLAYNGGGWTGLHSSVSDGVNTYVRDQDTGAGGIYISLNRASNITGGTRTVTCTFDQSSIARTMFITEWSGMANSLPLDTTIAGAGTSTSTAVSLTTTNADDLVIVFSVLDSGTVTFTGVAGTTLRDSEPNGANVVGASGDRILSATGTYSVGFTMASFPWATVAAAYKIAGAAPPAIVKHKVLIQ